jgi:glycosyltransferase involved in cell wall biosynthesis
LVFWPRTSEIALVIPVINEGDRLLGQLAAIQQGGLGIDVLVADGGSTDGSTDHAALERLGVRCLLTQRNGLSSQLRCAMEQVLEDGYTGMITMDGNGKDGVDGILRIARALEEGADFVQGSRWMPGGVAINTPIHRTLAARFIHAPVTSVAARKRFTDTTNGFRGLSRGLLTHPGIQALRATFTGYELLAYLPIAASRAGLRVAEVPVTRSYPSAGPIPTKISGVGHHLRLLKVLWNAARGRYAPNSSWAGLRPGP